MATLSGCCDSCRVATAVVVTRPIFPSSDHKSSVNKRDTSLFHVKHPQESAGESFGDRLVAAQRKRRVTNAEIADAVGKSLGTVSKWRHGHQEPDDEATWDALASLLGRSKSWLRYGDPIPTVRTNDSSDAWGTAFREGRRSVLRELRAWLESEEKRLGPET